MPYLTVGSVCPEILEAPWGQLSVANRILNVLVSQISLNRSGVMSFGSQVEPTGSRVHMRMHI